MAATMGPMTHPRPQAQVPHDMFTQIYFLHSSMTVKTSSLVYSLYTHPSHQKQVLGAGCTELPRIFHAVSFSRPGLAHSFLPLLSPSLRPFHTDAADPPPAPGALATVPTSFESAEQYKDVWFPLLLEELRAQTLSEIGTEGLGPGVAVRTLLIKGGGACSLIRM